MFCGEKLIDFYVRLTRLTPLFESCLWPNNGHLKNVFPTRLHRRLSLHCKGTAMVSWTFPYQDLCALNGDGKESLPSPPIWFASHFICTFVHIGVGGWAQNLRPFLWLPQESQSTETVCAHVLLLLSPEAGWLASIELVIWFYVAIILLKSIFENIVYA